MVVIPFDWLPWGKWKRKRTTPLLFWRDGHPWRSSQGSREGGRQDIGNSRETWLLHS